jgi:hypothetical protein
MSLNQSQFLSNANYQTVVGFLRKHYASRMGAQSIPERMDGRIQKTVQHFMTEVARVHGAQRPVQQLDQEVIRAATQSLDEWLHKNTAGPEMRPPPPHSALMPQVIPKATTVSAAAYSRPRVPATPTGVPHSPPAYEEINALYANLDKSVGNVAWPQPVEEEQEDPVLLMKKAQKQREAEMLAGKAEPCMDIAEMATTSVDPTPQVQPPPIRTAPLPQDYIIPQEPVVKYRNTEYNIFLTSSDRDWFRNRTENRYNFSVTFNPGNRTGYGYSPSVQERFRNIERIEFVKAIVPTESLTQLIRSTASAATVLNADRVINVLSLPFAGIRIAELNNNGFSTNPREDNTFALVQYDATWHSNIAINQASTSAAEPLSAVGYTALIPKFLKCQRVYEPTPLAGLQKLTLRMERHDGSVLSNDPDVFSIQRICLSSNSTYTAGPPSTGIATVDATNYAGVNNEYIYIQTASYFPGSAMAEGDLIAIQGYTVAATGTSAPSDATRLDFENYINAPDALNVVAIGHVHVIGGIVTLSPGVNAAGYANVIIVRSRFEDPATGSVGRSYFGGSATEDGFLELRIRDQATTAATAALINLSRQTHVVLRVITRDMDSASNIRPDNV